MSQITSRQAKKLSDYKAPEFTITDVELSFELNPEATMLTAVYQLQSGSGKAGTPTLELSTWSLGGSPKTGSVI